MNSFIVNFIWEKFKSAFIVAAVLGLIIYIVFDGTLLLDFGFGFLIGCINFLLLSIGTNLLMEAKANKAMIIHFLFFILRYLLIAYAIIEQIKIRDANIFAMTGGLIIIKLSIVLSAFSKNFLLRKEG